MRIISKFRDYYDGLMDYNKDDYLNRIYVRETKDVKVNFNEIKDLDKVGVFLGRVTKQKLLLHNDWIVIAGKVIPYVYTSKSSWETKPQYKTDLYGFRRKFYYDTESIIKDYPEMNYRDFIKTVDALFSDKPDMTELCIKLDTPIFRLKYSFIEDGLATIEINSELLQLGINTLYDAHQAYQIIDQFMSNVLVKDVMVARPLTDIEKLESKGFDKATSFRNAK